MAFLFLVKITILIVQGHNYLRAIYFNIIYNFQEINFIHKLKKPD